MLRLYLYEAFLLSCSVFYFNVLVWNKFCLNWKINQDKGGRKTEDEGRKKESENKTKKQNRESGESGEERRKKIGVTPK